MENNEIMTNEEVMETTEEIVKVSSANGFKKAVRLWIGVYCRLCSR